MKTYIVKYVLCVSMIFILFVDNANAFIFSDIAALAQRAAQFIQTAKSYADQYTHLQQFIGYVTEFQDYRRQFESYEKQFQNVYRKISTGDYARSFDVSEWDWKRLDDHILRAYRTYNKAAWDMQRLALRTSSLIETNPLYRRYVERLEVLMDNVEQRAKEKESDLDITENDINTRRITLLELRNTNRELSTEDDVSASQLASLQNRLLLELVQNNIDRDFKEVQQQRIDQEIASILAELDSMMREAQGNEARSFEWIFNTTTSGD